jgi:phage head maturation protease
VKAEAWPDRDRRVLQHLELVEVSIVRSVPAYAGTSVQARQRYGRNDHTLAAARLAALGVTSVMSPAARRRFLQTL